jgi:hypothetical protein
MTASEGALHSLLCDRCKKGACRPDRAEVLPRALLLLTRDADAHVRAMGVEATNSSTTTRAPGRRSSKRLAPMQAPKFVRRPVGMPRAAPSSGVLCQGRIGARPASPSLHCGSCRTSKNRKQQHSLLPIPG